MNVCLELYQIYYTIIIKILSVYPNAIFGIRWSDDQNYFVDVKIPDLSDKKILGEIIQNTDENNLKIEHQELSLNEYLDELDKTNQEQQKNILFNYLLYGKYFLKLPSEKYFINSLESIIWEFNKYDWGITNLLDNINYSFFKFKEIKENEIELIEDNTVQVISLEIEIYVTHLFICLAALIDNLLVKGYPIEKYLGQIQIKEYERFIWSKKVSVTSITELVKHYRDAVCHREIENNNISSSTVGGGKKLFNFKGPNLDCEIIFGMGSIHVTNQIIPLLKRLKILLIDKKLPVIKVIDKFGNTLFCDIFFNYDENIPIKGYHINCLDDNLFRFIIPINY